MRINVLTSVLLVLNITATASNIDFSEKEKAIIYTNSLNILKEYESIINEMGVNVVSDIEKAKSNAEELIELFINRQVIIFNDLDPSHKLSKFYEAETYFANLLLWYPDGISINLEFENVRVSELMKHEDDIYSLDIKINKKINGNYLNQALNKNLENLTFRIAFSTTNKSFHNFKIVGVRSTESNDLLDYSKSLKELNSENLSDEELNKVYDGIKSILNDYNNFLALLGDPIEEEEDKVYYRESFSQLFIDSETKVYNDINPDLEKSLISVDDYLKDFQDNYPEGINNISLTIDSTDFGKVIKADEGNYYSYAYTNKFFSGKFKGKEAYSQMSPLSFKITFEKSGRAYTGYKIESIDISGSEFFKESASNQEVVTPDLPIKLVSRKGLSLAFFGSYGLSFLKDQNIDQLSLASDNHEWNVSNNYGLNAGIGIQYFFNDRFGIETGLYFDTYKALFNLEGEFQDNELSTDVNDDSFYKIIETAIDSMVNLNYITLPILANYCYGEPGSLGFYANVGMHVSYLFSSTYNIKGNYKYSGYYPGNPEVIQYLDIEELGFYNRENIDETGDIETSLLNLSFYGSVGVSIPFGFYSSLTIGPEVIIGLTDVMGNRSNYIDIFGNTSTSKPTRIQKIGLKIGFVYKL